MPPAPDASSAFEIIARSLAPYLGQSMAKAAVEVNRTKLRLNGSHLNPSDIELLLEEIRPGLRVFLGDAQTMRVLDGVRAKLALKGSDR